MNEPSGLARLASLQLEQITRLGVPRVELLEAAGLTEGQLQDPDGRIPLSAIAKLWRATTSRVTDPVLGLRMGAGATARDLGLVGYTLLYSHTLGQALQRLVRYSRIISDALAVHVEAGEGGMWVRVHVQPALHAFRPAADARLAALLSVCREITAASVVPLATQLPYRQPRDVREYEKFFGAPVEFGALGTAFLLADGDVTRPLVQADPGLTGYLERLAQQVLAALDADRTMRGRLRQALWSELSAGVPDLEQVARGLGMGPRTLQRRLAAEGTTFAGVLTELRRDMAQALLGEGRLAVSEVAFLLGYEDAGSFQRAFRRWSGLSPRAFRRMSTLA